MPATAKQQLTTLIVQWAKKVESAPQLADLVRCYLELTGTSDKGSAGRRRLSAKAKLLMGQALKSGNKP